MAVGVNYGTGPKVTLGQRRNAEQDACEDSEARHATVPYQPVGYVMWQHYWVGGAVFAWLYFVPVGRQLFARLRRRIVFIITTLESGARLTHNVATRYDERSGRQRTTAATTTAHVGKLGCAYADVVFTTLQRQVTTCCTWKAKMPQVRG